MKTFRAKTGPFTERPYYSDEEIETVCNDELRALSLLPDSPAPIRIDRFIEKRFVVPQYEDLEEGILGLTTFGPNGVKEIIVSRSLEEEGTVSARRRVRTTLAHEGGHGLFHTHLFALDRASKPLFGDFSDPSAPKVLCRDEAASAGGYKGEWWEFQANKAISALLMPRFLVHAAITEFMEPAGLLAIPTFDHSRLANAVDHLSEVFDVNPIVAKIRVQQLFPALDSRQLTL